PRHSTLFPYTTLFRSVAILGLPGRGEPPLDFNPLSMEWLYAKSLTLTAVTTPVSTLYDTPGHRFSFPNTARALLDLMAAGTLERSEEHTSELQSRFDL